jgi:ATP-binding cassette, subfamily C, bacterial exporter for protease/lipase
MALRPSTPGKPKPLASPLARALRLGVGPIAFAALFSFVSNMLYLALPIFTNQVYSRILPSQSLPSLAVLSAGCAFVFLISSIIDYYRAQVLSGFGVVFDQQVASRTFAALFDAVVRRRGTRAQALRDLDTVRAAIAGRSINLLFDLPWVPVFMIVLFLIDPWVGAVTLVGGLVLILLAIMQDRASHSALKEAGEASIASYGFTDAALRNGEVVRALGMLPTIGRQWSRERFKAISAGNRAERSGGAYGNAIRYVRMLIQILIIAIGAMLVIDRSISSGMLFANMILSSRALAPLERVVGSWKSLFDSVQAYKRLDAILLEYEPPEAVTKLPVPSGRLSVEGVSFAPAGAAALVLSNLRFRIEPGEFVGVVGPSGAGKSTLARLLVGIWKPNAGAIRLDGADVYSWDREDFGRQVAYQPQDTELFAGTVRDNIARFRSDATDEAVVAAAQLANAHELILRLPKGYETELGEGGAVLSSGQRQRVGLARTLFGEPKLLILDEPNANLDSEGEAALLKALAEIKARGSTVVLISHKPSVFQNADKILLLVAGQVAEYGPRDEVLAKIAKGAGVARPAIKEARA